MAARVANALIKRITLPASFCVDVRKKIIEMSSEDEGICSTKISDICLAKNIRHIFRENDDPLFFKICRIHTRS